MLTRVKTPREIQSMREGGKILAEILRILESTITDGMTTKDLAEIAKAELKAKGGQPTFLGYQGFPDILCVSVNDEVVHGIPSKTKIIRNGDIVSLDFGVTYEALVTDAAITTIVGDPIDKRHVRLLEDTKASLWAGMETLQDGVKTGDIGFAIQQVLEEGKYGIVRDLVGHGVGQEMHETPNIPNYGHKGSGPILRSGMTIAIEPMATLGDYRVLLDPDNWTFRTADGSMSAHFENTVLITDQGYEILTQV